ncbi:MAG: UvrD-helicase domain-containing protein [Alteromonadaceae bacterium]|nr:UvrD-helicase domain-containing protein [Alteromonadaceae bacterium]
MDYQPFVDGNKSLLIAPAGYGKTYTIVECLKYTLGRQLILTHTHAGVASIKEKIVKARINADQYTVETISGFSQKYLNAFYVGLDVPEQDSKDYHSFVIGKTSALLLSPIIKQILKASYNGLFVDEYQDCTKLQHTLIMELANLLPTRILGDPLQGIFNFNGQIVDFDTDLLEFERFPDLKIPYRWYQEGNNKLLGDLIKGYREPLSNGESITVNTISSRKLYVILVDDEDFDDPKSVYRQKISSLIRNDKEDPSFESLLIIVPEYTEIDQGKEIKKGGISERGKILSKIDYSKSVVLLEAIDDKKFYDLSNDIDQFIDSVNTARKPVKKLYKLLSDLFCKTSPGKRKNIGLNDWISTNPKGNNGDYYIKAKKSEAGTLADLLRTRIESLILTPSQQGIYSLLIYIKKDLRIRIQVRRELLTSVIKALNNSVTENITVYESMKAYKNILRRVGRKVHEKCIGTTLLTKGLEFDTVAILDAHKFDCPKHLYVALTRCCKNLVLFTTQNTLPAKIK